MKKRDYLLGSLFLYTSCKRNPYPLPFFFSHEGDVDIGFEGAVPREGDVDVVDVHKGEVPVGEGEEFVFTDGDKTWGDGADVDIGGFAVRVGDDVFLEVLADVCLVAPVIEVACGEESCAFRIACFVCEDALCDDETDGVIGGVPAAVCVEVIEESAFGEEAHEAVVCTVGIFDVGECDFFTACEFSLYRVGEGAMRVGDGAVV